MTRRCSAGGLASPLQTRLAAAHTASRAPNRTCVAASIMLCICSALFSVMWVAGVCLAPCQPLLTCSCCPAGVGPIAVPPPIARLCCSMVWRNLLAFRYASICMRQDGEQSGGRRIVQLDTSWPAPHNRPWGDAGQRRCYITQHGCQPHGEGFEEK